MTTRHTIADSPMGPLTLVADEGRLIGVYFPHHWYRPDPATFGPWAEAGFEEAKSQLAGYFAGQRERFELPVEPRGVPFQKKVWELVEDIGYGHTATYGELARELGPRVTPKDVGAAVGRNPLSVVVPCHRVVGKDGRLTGYAGGLARKRFLLDLEANAAGTSQALFALTTARSAG
jgi:methylated-DNA-[protein]-cysteine S-methyltransferase